MTTPTGQVQEVPEEQTALLGGLPVRTDLHAGNACWDELNQQAAKLMNMVSGAASNVAKTFTGGKTNPPPAS